MNALRLIAVYAGACGLVLWSVHRLVRPLSLRASAALALLPLVLTGSALFTGAFWGGLNLAYTTAPLGARANELPLAAADYDNGILLDHICEIVPWRKAVREAIRTGHAPLWNRFSRSGDILLGAAQPAPFIRESGSDSSCRSRRPSRSAAASPSSSRRSSPSSISPSSV